MKIKYSALVSATSGKLNGSVAASNRGGAYLRNKGVTSNPRTVSQQANRSRFGAISSQFRSLTPEQVAAWNVAAQDFPIIDRFGDTRFLSGLALYVQLNKNLADIGAAGIVLPPVKQSFPNIAGVAFSVVTAGIAPASFNVELSSDTPIASDLRMLVRATPSVSPSIAFVKNRFRSIGVGPAPVGTSILFEDYNKYVSVVGTPAIGQVVHLEAVLISNISGEKSAPFIVSAVVEEGE